MSDRMTPIPFGKLMDWVLTEYKEYGTIFGVQKFYKASGKTQGIFKERLETPFGPAAGPHTQLAQNIIASYVGGSRFFEVKTVQILDGEDLPVSKPCITAADECYNCEWSTELRVPQAFDEYVKGWFALKLISREFGFGAPDGFVFNMSVGYDLAGIKSEKIDRYIEGMKEAGDTPIWKECAAWAKENIGKFKNIDAAYIDAIPSKAADSITLSTLHGCPPDEIERIATYLITEKNLNTFIKCNPTLLDYKYARATLDSLGFDYISFDDHHFGADLQWKDAIPMFKRLQQLTDERGLAFGVKITNTFPVKVTAGELPSEEMYMSGRSLFPLSISLANRLAKEFDGALRISYSGGADIYNIDKIVEAGVWPVTLATTLLKPGGYNRLAQMAGKLTECGWKAFDGVNAAKLQAIVDDIKTNPHYKKPIKPAPQRKMKAEVPLLDCFEAPCRDGCPINQDIPAYLRLAGEEKYLEALRVITERNPLPFITGTICAHRCMDKCTRAFYEESVNIRGAKLLAAQMAYKDLMQEVKAPEVTARTPVAVIGGGPAGLAAAYFLAKAGCAVTLYEKREGLGGIVRQVIPAFRIKDEAIDNDVALVRAMGVHIVTGAEIKTIAELRDKGFAHVVVATGAWNPGRLPLQYGAAMNVIAFLDALKNKPDSLPLGENVVVIGGGNTAMDAARAAKRADGVKKVSLVYRRTKRYMPADEEELALAIEDGVEFCELLAPVGVKNGKLKCQKMELGPPDASGRRSPVATDAFTEIPADTVVSAVGELVDTPFYNANNIKVDEKGKAVVDPETLECNLSGVYIAGDAHRGPATVVEAIADAAKIADAIAKLKNERYANLNLSDNIEKPKAKKGVLFPDIFDATESERCLECKTVCECCVDVCPNRANVEVLVNGKAQIVHVDYMCNECGNCETFCPYSSAPYKDKFTLFQSAEDLANSENEGFARLGGGRVKVRLDNQTADHDLSDTTLPEGIAALIKATCDSYGYMLI